MTVGTNSKAAADGLRYSIGGPLLEGIGETVEQHCTMGKANRQLIAQRMRGLIRGLGSAIRVLAAGFMLVWRGLNFVIDRWKLFAALIIGSLAAIAIANAGAVISFPWCSCRCNRLVIAAAAAWVVAAAPFVALAAVIAVVLLALEDLWVLHGGKSLIGDVGKELARLVSDFRR